MVPKRTIHALFSICIFLSYASVCSALKCYDCGGPVDKNLACSGITGDEYLRDCNVSTVCAQYIEKTPTERVLTRLCAPSGICSILENQFVNNPAVKISGCSVCTAEKCNGGAIPVTEKADDSDSSVRGLAVSWVLVTLTALFIFVIFE